MEWLFPAKQQNNTLQRETERNSTAAIFQSRPRYESPNQANGARFPPGSYRIQTRRWSKIFFTFFECNFFFLFFECALFNCWFQAQSAFWCSAIHILIQCLDSPFLAIERQVKMCAHKMVRDEINVSPRNSYFLGLDPMLRLDFKRWRMRRRCDSPHFWVNSIQEGNWRL